MAAIRQSTTEEARRAAKIALAGPAAQPTRRGDRRRAAPGTIFIPQLEAPLPRPPRPEDLYRLRVATEPRLSPDGRFVAVTVQTVAPAYDGYRSAIWLVPRKKGAKPRQVTLGARRDRHPGSRPMAGRSRSFRSRSIVEEEPGGPRRRTARTQSRSPAAARRRRGAAADRPAPRRRRLRMVARRHAGWSSSRVASARPGPRTTAAAASTGSPSRARRRHPTTGSSTASTTCSTARASRTTGSPHLWLVDVATGEASRLTEGRSPTASRRGRRTADGSPSRSNRRRERRPGLGTLGHPRRRRRDARGDRHHARAAVDRSSRPAWLPDGVTIAALGHRFRAAPAAGTTCGCSRRTARTRRRPVAGTSRRRTT